MRPGRAQTSVLLGTSSLSARRPDGHHGLVGGGDGRDETAFFSVAGRQVVGPDALEQETAASTVSRAEGRQIRTGTTRARVRQIVGNGGRDPYRYDGHSQRTYDMVPFWRWSVIRFRAGRVTDTWWDVGHD